MSEIHPIEPIPTRRAVIDPLRLCRLRCVMCYYLHDEMKSVRPWPEVQADIDAAVERGNTHCDITGGEPLLYPELPELIRYCQKVGLKPRIISSLIASEQAFDRAVEAGPDAWLISMHGMPETHDKIVRLFKAHEMQEARLNKINGNVAIDINCVITRYNQCELALFALFFSKRWDIRFVNFICFNAHRGWRNDPTTKDLIPDLEITERELNKAIQLLESIGISVTVRYYPMCRIAEKYRRCVSNDLQVTFDPYEWDYDIQPKTFEAHLEWGKRTSEKTEEKGEPCCRCELHNICGGWNKYGHAASQETFGEQLIPQYDTGVTDLNDIYYYRKWHRTTLEHYPQESTR